jgi:hypothetical protein
MHRPFWLRTLIAVWGLWFATSVVEPAGLFACAMHGTGAASGAYAGPESGHAATADHSHHGASPGSVHVIAATVHVSEPLQESGQQHHDCCTCLGHCCQSMPVGAPTTPLALVPLLRGDAATAAIAVSTRAVTRRPFALPFANGPPAPTPLLA